MLENDKEYFINNPVFLNYKTRFDFQKLRPVRYLKSVYMNERIVENPFAVAHVAALPPGSRVLDLGCTESTLPLQLAAFGYQVTGFDFRKYPYQHPNLEFVQGDLVRLPFPEESFDAALSISTIEHAGLGFYTDPRQIEGADLKAVHEVRRVLKKNGIFILTVPFGQGGMTAHQRVYDERNLSALVGDFRVEEKRYFASFSPPGSKSNCWQEIELSRAAKIHSRQSTECVCLVKAKKITP